jgi:xanthine phosphoribosyltransferase
MQLHGEWEYQNADGTPRTSVVPNKYHVSWECVQEAAQKLSGMLHAAWGNSEFGIIAIAHGGLIPAALLARECKHVPEIQSIICKSYEGTEQKKPVVTWSKTPKMEDHGRYAVVDDIYDSGDTIAAVLKYMKQWNPAGVSRGHVIPVVLFSRKHSKGPGPTFYGCQIPDDRWVVFPWEPGWMQFKSQPEKIRDWEITPEGDKPITITGDDVYLSARDPQIVISGDTVVVDLYNLEGPEEDHLAHLTLDKETYNWLYNEVPLPDATEVTQPEARFTHVYGVDHPIVDLNHSHYEGGYLRHPKATREDDVFLRSYGPNTVEVSKTPYTSPAAILPTNMTETDKRWVQGEINKAVAAMERRLVRIYGVGVAGR